LIDSKAELSRRTSWQLLAGKPGTQSKIINPNPANALGQ
jgi:hypothetical protein